MAAIRNNGASFNLGSASSPTFVLLGGRYDVRAIAASWGTVTLQSIGPDSSTLLNAATAFAANGMVSPITLGPGAYQFTVAAATGAYASIAPVSQLGS
jgi:hypothetical protein